MPTAPQDQRVDVSTSRRRDDGSPDQLAVRVDVTRSDATGFFEAATAAAVQRHAELEALVRARVEETFAGGPEDRAECAARNELALVELDRAPIAARFEAARESIDAGAAGEDLDRARLAARAAMDDLNATSGRFAAALVAVAEAERASLDRRAELHQLLWPAVADARRADLAGQWDRLARRAADLALDLAAEHLAVVDQLGLLDRAAAAPGHLDSPEPE